MGNSYPRIRERRQGLEQHGAQLNALMIESSATCCSVCGRVLQPLECRATPKPLGSSCDVVQP
jgi:hypothetical protein